MAPLETFESGLEKTVRWYLENEAWWRPIVRAAATLDSALAWRARAAGA